MAAITRKTAKIFGGSLSPTNNIAKFGSLLAGTPAYSSDPADIQTSAWLQGWPGAVVPVGGVPNVPAIQDMTAAFYVLAYQLAYLLERGVPEWDTGTTYFQYDLCRKNGVLYESRTNTNAGNDPASSHTNWASTALACGVANSAQNIAVDSAGHVIDFDTEAFDTDGAFDSGTNKFTAPVAGIYSVSANVQVDNDDADPATIEFSMAVVKNSATTVLVDGDSVPSPAGARWYPKVAGLVQLAAGDTLEIQLSGTDVPGSGHVDLSNGNLSIQRTRAV